jgi:hypothetical protein
MPDKQPQPQQALAGRHQTQQDRSDEASLELPHERDQASDMTGAQPDPKIKQAAKDVASGLSDTSKAGETDKAYKNSGIEARPGPARRGAAARRVVYAIN